MGFWEIIGGAILVFLIIPFVMYLYTYAIASAIEDAKKRSDNNKTKWL